MLFARWQLGHGPRTNKNPVSIWNSPFQRLETVPDGGFCGKIIDGLNIDSPQRILFPNIPVLMLLHV